ncbi:MAG: hypothetical protein ACRDHW_20180, partial [Ktedonobacteraceae bacterium]
PALISGLANGNLDWANLAIFIVGPIIGGIVGAVLYHLIRQPADVIAETEEEAFSEVPTTPKPKINPVIYKQKARTRR